MAVKLFFNALPAFLDGNGNPLSGGKLFTYVAGSTTKQTTYQDSGGVTPHANPIVLTSRGEPPAAMWGTTGVTYKLVLCPSTDTDPPGSPIWTVDAISGINDSTVSQDQWVSGPTPTYVSSTQFTLAGDKTTDFHVGRRLKSTITAGTGYHTITVSAYSTGTTTITVNGTALDSGLSAISYGLITYNNTSLPNFNTLITNSLSGNVALTDVAAYFTGPTVAQGTAGAWWASGTVTMWDTAGASAFHLKLWDGTTVIASAYTQATTANTPISASLSGYLASPAGNIRISVKGTGSTSGVILFNATSNSKDSTLSAFRIA